jgi:hypothetical protein
MLVRQRGIKEVRDAPAFGYTCTCPPEDLVIGARNFHYLIQGKRKERKIKYNPCIVKKKEGEVEGGGALTVVSSH